MSQATKKVRASPKAYYSPQGESLTIEDARRIISLVDSIGGKKSRPRASKQNSGANSPAEKSKSSRGLDGYRALVAEAANKGLRVVTEDGQLLKAEQIKTLLGIQPPPPPTPPAAK